MTDPALRYLAARRQLSFIPRIIDHLLKEAAENPIGSRERYDRIRALQKLFGLRNRLRRDEDSAAKLLAAELPREPQPPGGPLTDRPGQPMVDGGIVPGSPQQLREWAEYDVKAATYRQELESSEERVERLLAPLLREADIGPLADK